MKYAPKWSDRSLVRKIAHLPERIFSKWFQNSETAYRLRRKIQKRLLDEVLFVLQFLTEIRTFCKCSFEKFKKNGGCAVIDSLCSAFQLPSTEPIIEEIFCDKVEPVWSDFIAQLLIHTHASQKLVYDVVEKCGDDVLKLVNSQFDLCQAIASKIDWNGVEDTTLLMLMLLIKLAAKFNKQITQFYKVLCLKVFH